MKNLFIFLLVFGLATPVFAQITELEEVVIYPVKYKYLFEVVDDDIDKSVKDLQFKLANFDITKEEYYSDEYDEYNVSFYIPKGYALASYDKEGKLIKTIERYKNVKLPVAVRDAVAKRFPKWIVDQDIYKVIYNDEKWESKKIYKLKLVNGKETIRVKTDEDGTFL